MKIYLSGPMSGYPDHNFPAFEAETKRLRGLGYSILSPHEIKHLDQSNWSACLRKDLVSMLLQCDTIAMLPNWQLSRGALLEEYVARALGFAIIESHLITEPYDEARTVL